MHLRPRGHRDYRHALGRVMPDYARRREDLRQAGRRAGVVTVACLSSLLQVVLQNTQPARQRARIRNAERLYAAPPPVRIGET